MLKKKRQAEIAIKKQITNFVHEGLSWVFLQGSSVFCSSDPFLPLCNFKEVQISQLANA